MKLLISALLIAPLVALPASAWAAGDSSGDGQTVTKCKDGDVWDTKAKKCVKKTSALDDESIYEAGRDLAYAGRYNEAIEVLALAHDKTDPRILNFLGYSHRKSGRLQVGLGYYQEALRIDPNYTLVREYLGEAHLQMGDLAGAQEQLGEIARRKGSASPEYVALAREIERFRQG